MGIFDWKALLQLSVRWLLAVAAIALPLVSAGAAPAAEAHHEPLPNPLRENWVTLLCKYQDRPDEPHPVSWYEELVGGIEPGMGHYWQEVSYGAYGINLNPVLGWYLLPEDSAYYGQDLAKVAQDCVSAADPDIDFRQFHGINVLDNSVGNDKGHPQIRLRADGTEKDFRVTWVRDAAHWVLAHEMGHGLALAHSGSLGHLDNPYNVNYESDWDILSAGGTRSVCNGQGLIGVFPVQPGPFGCVGVHPLAVQKEILGWIPANRITVLPVDSHLTTTLERLAQPGPDGHLLAKIPLDASGSQYYAVEARRKVGYDANIPREGVVITKVDRQTEVYTRVVDGDNNGKVNDDGTVWLPGETFVDQANGITIRVLSDTGTGWTVSLSNEPLITIDDVAVTEPVSGTVSAWFQVRLLKPSSDSITVNYVTKNGSARSGEDYQQKSGTVTFAPGATSRWISVPVLADNVFEFDEQYFVELSNPQNAVILDGRGTGTIRNR